MADEETKPTDGTTEEQPKTVTEKATETASAVKDNVFSMFGGGSQTAKKPETTEEERTTTAPAAPKLKKKRQQPKARKGRRKQRKRKPMCILSLLFT